MPPGSLDIWARADGYAPATGAAVSGSGADLTLELSRGATIEVAVVDGAGAPRAGTTVATFQPVGPVLQALTAVEGRDTFRLPGEGEHVVGVHSGTGSATIPGAEQLALKAPSEQHVVIALALAGDPS